MTTDHNDIRIKPGHDGVSAPPFGPMVWILKRYDDKMVGGPWKTRHDAIGARARVIRGTKANKAEWWEPERVPVGSIRMNDLVVVE